MTPRSFLFLMVMIIFASCGSEDSSKDVDTSREQGSKQLTSIQWIDSVRNFGKILEGQKLALSFRFKNTGDKPLVIESVTPACGCTVADYPKQPLQPGNEGEITGEFNSEGREGQQHKEITVTTNTPSRTKNLIFEVTVTGKAPQATN
ncbi:MAG TPA: DUF1573 domain-containing protein [Flavitalea sp.]|nr:DUF1573 domain-containing protein [Flavitalea sp.]